jgi:choline dehydrogenase-like flavoprotein
MERRVWVPFIYNSIYTKKITKVLKEDNLGRQYTSQHTIAQTIRQQKQEKIQMMQNHVQRYNKPIVIPRWMSLTF